MAVLKNQKRFVQTNHAFKMCNAFETYLVEIKYKYIDRHMAVTPFKSPFSESLKYRNSQEIRSQGSGSRFFKQFSYDTAGYSKTRFELYFWNHASNKIKFQIFAFLIIAAGL